MKTNIEKRRTVNFQDSMNGIEDSDQQTAQSKVPEYKSVAEARSLVIEAFNECNSKIKLFTQNDPTFKRKDTAKSVQKVLDQLKFAIMHLNLGTYDDKQKNYYLAYNGTIQIFDLCQLLRKYQYHSLIIDYLGFSICTIEAHLIMNNIKYLEWRIKLYVELAKVYEEIGSNDVALKTIDAGIKKVNELQQILEQDPPLPNHTKKIIENCLRTLRILEIKYRLQLGLLAGDLYKKKLEEFFSNDKEARCAAIVESLRSKQFNYIEQQNKGCVWKDHAIKQSFELLKPEIQIISDYIKQILTQIEYQEKQEIDEDTRIKTFNEKMALNLVQNSRLKDAIRSIPLEYHIELTFHAYDVNNQLIYEDLSQSAYFRCKYRRIEVPYITDIKIVVSSHPNPNIPNGYEKIDIDINEAALKILLKKNRIFKEDEQKVPVQELVKKDEKKGQKKDPKQAPQGAQETNQEEKKNYQEAIPGIKHEYTYILVKRSISSENAVCDFKLILSQENNPNSPALKPFIDKNYRIIECPVQQYTGVRETNKKVVFICFKCTEDNLKNEEEKKTLLLDIKPIFGKSPLISSDFGYEKIPLDLRQTPSEFIKHPDNDYLYLSYKTDKHFFSNERELKLLMNLQVLENSQIGDRLTTIKDIRAKQLDIFYDVEKLKNLFINMKSCLESPIGAQFYLERKEFLITLSFYIWKKYIVNQLQQIQYILDQTYQQQISQEEYDQLNDQIQPLKAVFKIGLKLFNLLLVRDPCRSLIWFIKCTLELAKILIQEDENQEASQFLKTCYDIVIMYRDEKLTRGVDSRDDMFIPYCITANNQKIQEIVQSMMSSYIKFKNEQGCTIREKIRERDLKSSLSHEEQQEELSELLHYNLFYKNDDNKDKSYFEHLPQEQYITQYDLIIQNLQVDLIYNYYLCQIKQGKQLSHLQKHSQKTNEFGSLNITKKMNLNKTKSFQETKQKLQNLQTDLQNAGRLPVPQPKIKDYEKSLKLHANKNPYLQSILFMVLASNKKQTAEQKYLLQQSLKQIEAANDMESQLASNAIQDSIYICSNLLKNISENKQLPQHFSLLYNPNYIIETDQPRTPILIHRSSNSLTIQLPPFNPRVNEMDYLSDPGVKDIRSMVLYGKVSANGVGVSTTCTDLQNTGIRFPNGSVVSIKGLQQNEGYCFAVAGFNVNEKQSKKIGETSQEIVTAQPLSINQLYAYLAKQSYYLGEWEIAEKAASECISFICQKSEVFDKNLDQLNPIVYLRLKAKTLQWYSAQELEYFTESLFIKSRCMAKKEQSTKIIDRHRNLCYRTNMGLLALELSASSGVTILGKRILIDIYNNIGEIVRIKSKFLFQILIKMYIFVQEIPKQFWDSFIRQFSAKLIYEISVLCFSYNQINLGKLVIYQGQNLPNRQFKLKPRCIEVSEDSQNQAKQAKKGGKEQQQVVASEEIKMVQKIVYSLEDDENLYQSYLEDALMNFTEEYGNLVQGFLDNWKDQLDYYSAYVENVDTLEKIKQNLTLKWNFWEMLKEPQTALSKIQIMFKPLPCYNEMLCKFAQRCIEIKSLKQAKEVLTQCEIITNETIECIENMFAIQMECYDHDISFVPWNLQIMKNESESNGDKENKSIELFEKYNALKSKLIKDDYVTLWRAEFYYLKALTSYLDYFKEAKETSSDIYFEIDRLDLDKIQQTIKEFKDTNSNSKLNQNQIDFFQELMKNLALASYFSLLSNASYQLQNIIKFCQNINIREQMNPFDYKLSRTNLYSLFIGQCIINQFNIKNNIPQGQELYQNLTKDYWFNKAEFQVYADYCASIINALLIQEKVVLLSDFCKNLCNVTQHFYSNLVIPFMIYAITLQEDKAGDLVKERQAVLEQKTIEYEAWKNGKRRKNRAAALTGEIPPEELQFMSDKTLLDNTIKILLDKQHRITFKKKIAMNVLSEIQRDTYQPELELFECKRLLFQFGDEQKLSEVDSNLAQKKIQQGWGKSLIKKYEGIIEKMKKRNDKAGQVRALTQIGDLFYATSSISKSEEKWNEALDTIFQQLHTLSASSIIKIELNEFNALLACTLLYRLSKYCYFNNHYKQQQCFVFSGRLAFHVFQFQLTNPQALPSFIETRIISLPADLFNSGLDPICLIQALDFLAQQQLDNGQALQALPSLALMDHIALKVIQSDFYSVRAKLFKSIVLSSIGSINQAYSLLQQVKEEKCLGSGLLGESESLGLLTGQSWFGNYKDYLNHMPFFQDHNKDVIDTMNKLELPQHFNTKYGYFNNSLFEYARTSLIFNIHKNEIIDRPENNDQRINMIQKLEIRIRDLLVLLQKTQNNYIQSEKGNINEDANSPLNAQESQEDRLCLMYRSRNLLGEMSLCQGQLTKAYYIYKNGIIVIQNHIFNYPGAETGKEPENDLTILQAPTAGQKDNKKAAKDPKAKPIKGQIQEEEKKEIKFEYNWSQLTSNKKRQHLNGFWYIKYKYSIIDIFYQQRRFTEIKTLIEHFKQDCESLHDNYVLNLIKELEGRIDIASGKVQQGMLILQSILQNNNYVDIQFGKLSADYGEILYEQFEYDQAAQYFQKAKDIFAQIKEDFRFSQGQSINKKAELEKIQIMEKYQFPLDIMDQLQKKEAKIRKDDKKSGKEPAKKEVKGQKQVEVVEFKVTPFNQINQIDLLQTDKLIFSELMPETPLPLSIYIDFLPFYLKACLRLTQCKLVLNQYEEALKYLNEMEPFILNSFNLPQSFKLEFYYLSAMNYKKMFIKKVNDYYEPYQKKYLQEKNRKYKKLHERIPYRDLPRNKYLLDLPGFSQSLKEDLIPNYLLKSKNYFKLVNSVIKGDCIYFENNKNIDNIIMEMADLILLQREYFPRLDYKYFQQEHDERWEKLRQMETVDKLNLELEAFQMINFAMTATACRREILQTSLNSISITDQSKIPQDIINDIFETDFIYKKNYNPILFDETKQKKTTVTSLDLISHLTKLYQESRLMTFKGDKCQKLIQKIHRFLKSYHTLYTQKCVLTNLDITTKGMGVDVVFIEDGLLKFKAIAKDNEYKFIYILSRFDTKKIQSKLLPDQLEKLNLNNEDKEVLYGSFYIDFNLLSEFDLKANSLKTKLIESSSQSQSVKERDYRRLQIDYMDIFTNIGNIFTKRPSSQKSTQNYDVYQDKFVDCVPPLSIENVNLLVRLFGPEGLEIENHNLVLLFRNYHKMKYR